MKPASWGNSPRFLLAFFLSMSLHSFLFMPRPRLEERPPPPAPPRASLEAMLKTPAPPLSLLPPPPLPEQELKTAQTSSPPETAKPKPALPRPPRPILQAPANAASDTISTAVLQSASRQFAQQAHFYPLEAVADGLEGDVLVQIFLDEQGNVIAARVEESSGHSLLDQAALRAARALKGLPADAQEEALLPVRFRIK